MFLSCIVELSFCCCHLVTNNHFLLVFGLFSKTSVLCYSTFHLALRGRGIVLLCESQGKYIFELPCLIVSYSKASLENRFCSSIHPGLLHSEVIDVATVSDLNWLSQSSIMTPELKSLLDVYTKLIYLCMRA